MRKNGAAGQIEEQDEDSPGAQDVSSARIEVYYSESGQASKLEGPTQGPHHLTASVKERP